MIGDVAAHPRMGGAVESLLVEAEILHDEEVGLGVPPGRGRHRQGVRGRAQHRVDDVEFETRRAAADETEIAEFFVVIDPLEGPGDALVQAVRRARKIARDVEAFRRHADAGHRVQVAPAEAPHPAEFARALVVVLARIGPPSADAGFAAAHLGDDAAALVLVAGMVRVDPVPRVGAHIHQPAAALGVVVERVELGARIVLGMRAGDDDVVVLDAGEPVVGDVLVGEDVVLVAHRLQPVDQVEVGRVLPRRLGEEVVVFRPDRQDRPQTRRDRDAGAVGVGVVDRAAVFTVLGQEHVLLLHDRHAVDEQFRPARVAGHVLVGIGHVADGRHHHRDLGGLLADARHNPERDELLVALGRGQLGGVEAALHAGLRHAPSEVGGPAGVVHVVVVEADGTVFLRRVLPVEVLARPVVAGHAAVGAVHQRGVEAIRPLVLGSQGVDADGEIPGGDDAFGELAGRAGIAPFGQAGLGAGLHHLDLGARERPVAEARAVELAVILAGKDHAGRLRGGGERILGRQPLDIGAERDGHGGVGDRDLQARLDRLDLGIEGVDHLRLVDQRHEAGGGVEGRGAEMPSMVADRHASGDPVLVDAQLQAALLVDEEAVAALVRPFGHQPLRAVLPVARMGFWRGRPDPALEREALDVERLGIRHVAVGAAVDDLLPARIGAVDRRIDRLVDVARTARVGVAVDHLDDLDLVLGRTVAIDVKLDRIAGMDAELVGVTGQPHGGHRVNPLGSVSGPRPSVRVLARGAPGGASRPRADRRVLRKVRPPQVIGQLSSLRFQPS